MISVPTLAFIFFITLAMQLNNIGAKYWYFDFLLVRTELRL